MLRAGEVAEPRYPRSGILRIARGQPVADRGNSGSALHQSLNVRKLLLILDGVLPRTVKHRYCSSISFKSVFVVALHSRRRRCEESRAGLPQR